MRDEKAATEHRTKEFRDGLIREMKDLRAFAVSLSGSFHQADDLLQETC